MDGLRREALIRSPTGSHHSLLPAVLAMGAGWLGVPDVDAKKKCKHKRKRCKRLGDACTPGGERRCCDGRPCDEIPTKSGFFCGRRRRPRAATTRSAVAAGIWAAIDGAPGASCRGDEHTLCQVSDDCRGLLVCDLNGACVANEPSVEPRTRRPARTQVSERALSAGTGPTKLHTPFTYGGGCRGQLPWPRWERRLGTEPGALTADARSPRHLAS